MALFDDIPAKDLALLVRLPVRVGFWISQVDTTGGDAALESERTAINTMVTAYAEDYLKSEFVQRLMEKTVAERAEWSHWLDKLDAVPDECGRAARLLKDRISDRDLKTFKHNLLDIGLAVAMAFSEVDNVRKTSPFKRLIGILMGGITTATPDERISVIEYRALKEMAAAMGLRSSILDSAA